MIDKENLLASAEPDALDRALVERAVEGSREALTQLVERHQPFIFNLALKMFGSRADAEDLTQEVLVKVITSLRSFAHASSLRTWLYRVTINHFLNTRRRSRETTVESFSEYFDQVAAIPEEEPLEIADASIEELRLRCTSGMLLCLDRAQRITFILGAVFGVPQEVAAEMLEVTPGNFRVRLHRAREDLYNWMNARCGLVNAANPCRCRRKTAVLVKQGLVDPKRLEFNADYLVRIDALTRRDSRAAMDRIDDLNERVFTSHPFAEIDLKLVEAVLDDPTIRTFFSLDN